LRRTLQVGALFAGLVYEALRRSSRPEEPLFTFKTTDIEDHPIAVERYRWTQGGTA
jgi:hypothetical protein